MLITMGEGRRKDSETNQSQAPMDGCTEQLHSKYASSKKEMPVCILRKITFSNMFSYSQLFCNTAIRRFATGFGTGYQVVSRSTRMSAVTRGDQTLSTVQYYNMLQDMFTITLKY